MHSMWEDVASIDSVYTELLGLLKCMIGSVRQIEGSGVLPDIKLVAVVVAIFEGGVLCWVREPEPRLEPHRMGAVTRLGLSSAGRTW